MPELFTTSGALVPFGKGKSVPRACGAEISLRQQMMWCIILVGSCSFMVPPRYITSGEWQEQIRVGVDIHNRSATKLAYFYGMHKMYMYNLAYAAPLPSAVSRISISTPKTWCGVRPLCAGSGTGDVPSLAAGSALRLCGDGDDDGDVDGVKVECVEEGLDGEVERESYCKVNFRLLLLWGAGRLTHLSLRVNFEAGGGGIERGDLGDVVVLAFSLLLLQLEGNAADGATLDTLHQVGGEPRDFVAQAF